MRDFEWDDAIWAVVSEDGLSLAFLVFLMRKQKS